MKKLLLTIISLIAMFSMASAEKTAVAFRTVANYNTPYTWDTAPAETFDATVINTNSTLQMSQNDITVGWSSGLFISGGDWQLSMNGGTLTVTPSNEAKITSIGFAFYNGDNNDFTYSVDKEGSQATIGDKELWTAAAPVDGPVAITIPSTSYGDRWIEQIYVSYESDNGGGGGGGDVEDPDKWKLPDGYNFGGKVGAWVYENKVVSEVTYTIGEGPFRAPEFFQNPNFSGTVFASGGRDTESKVAYMNSDFVVTVVAEQPGQVVMYPTGEAGNQNAESAAVLIIKVVRPAADVEAPELFVMNGTDEMAYGNFYPVCPNTRLRFKSATAGATYKYTLDGSDPATSATAATGADLTFSTEDVDKSMTVKVVALADGKSSETITYTFDVHNWVLVDNTLTKFADNDYFMIVAPEQHKAMNSRSVMQGLVYGMGEVDFTPGYKNLYGNPEAGTEPAIFRKNAAISDNFVFTLLNEKGRYLSAMGTTLELSASLSTNANLKSEADGNFTLGGQTVRYKAASNGFGFSSDETLPVALLYAWAVTPEIPAPELSFSMDGQTYTSIDDVPSMISSTDVLEVVVPEDFVSSFKINDKVIAADLTGNVRINFKDCSGETNVEFTAVNGDITLSFTKKFDVKKSGVDVVAADSEAVYYDLLGNRVDGALAPGLYIRVANGTSLKVLVK